MQPSILQRTVDRAITAGLLPPSATPSDHKVDPWPVTLLSTLGAWLAALPLFGFITLIAGESLRKGIGPYITGGALLVGTLALLRTRELPRFLEQLSLPAILVALGVLSIGLFRDLLPPYAAGIACLLTLATAVLTDRRWLQMILGAIGSALAALCLYLPHERWGEAGASYWLAWTGNLVLLLFIRVGQEKLLVDGKSSRRVALLETISAGWTIMTLVALAVASGKAFLLDGILPVSPFDPNDLARFAHIRMERVASVALSLVASAWLAWHWPSLRRAWLGGVFLLVAGLSWFAPFMGATLLLTANSASRGRWRLAGVGALAIVWIVGSLYHSFDAPLAIKAVLLGVTAALLGALAWSAVVPALPAKPALRAPGIAPPRPLWIGVALSLLATLAVANIGIWRNEQAIEFGAPIFIELAPADPRSIMQGDYMALRFHIPSNLMPDDRAIKIGTPFVIATRNAKGVATVVRSGPDGTALAPNEFPIALSHSARGWVIVSDAWYFKEGDAEHWRPARYGEFRISPNGKALLVGLRDAQLRAL